MTIEAPRNADEWRHARTLVEEYAASLNVDLAYQDFAHEIEQLALEYGPPTGAFLLAHESDAYLGCVGLRRFDDDTGEVKRLYVRPAGRSRGLGRLLAESIIARARELRYKRLLLDTLPSMRDAQALYLSLGFRPTAPYRFSPVPGTVFLELTLHDSA